MSSRRDQDSLPALSTPRYQGLKAPKTSERYDDPFAHSAVEVAEGGSRSQSPLRGSITPPDYQRKTNLVNGRMNRTTNGAVKPSPSGGPVPRARVSSVKDRVALFERPGNQTASPLSSRPTSRSAQRAKTPTRSAPAVPMPKTSATSKVLQPQMPSQARATSNDRRSPKKLSKDGRPTVPRPNVKSSTSNGGSQSNRVSKSMLNLSERNSTSTSGSGQRQLLFGETFLPNTGPGYGIPGGRQRSGSEGSPMHSPNMMPGAYQSDSEEHVDRLQSFGERKSGERTKLHRRAQSDNQPAQSTSGTLDTAIPRPWMSSETRRGENPRQTQNSRLPVRARQTSQASDSADSHPSSRGSSALGRYPRSTTPSRGNRLQSHTTHRPSIPVGRASPARSISPHSKPDSRLTANIIAPPPKVSPPLRSSRPRQPIWASTAASRAKAVDDLQGSTSTAKPRAKPIELQNVDFAARRSKIINASAKEHLKISERRRIQLLQEAERKRQASIYSQEGAQGSEQDESPCADDSTSLDEEPDADIFRTPAEGRSPTLTLDTQNVSSRYPSQTEIPRPELDIDSPTLGAEHRMARLSISAAGGDFLQLGAHPQSAVSAGTDATPIDMEPQEDFGESQTQRTILSQIMQMRRPSVMASTYGDPSKIDVENESDRETVQFMLRNTAVFQDPADSEQSLSRHSPGPPSGTPSWTSWVDDEPTAAPIDQEQKPRESQRMSLARLSKAVSTGPVFPTSPLAISPRVSSARFNASRTGSRSSLQNGAMGRPPSSDSLSKFSMPGSFSVGPRSSKSRLNENRASDISLSSNHTKERQHVLQNEKFVESPLTYRLSPQRDIYNTENRASLTAREDFEQASPSLAQWSQFTAAVNLSTNEDDDKPTPPPKDADGLSNRSATPRGNRASTLPNIESVTNGGGLQIRIQSPGVPELQSYAVPPLPTYSPPPPPLKQGPLPPMRVSSQQDLSKTSFSSTGQQVSGFSTQVLDGVRPSVDTTASTLVNDGRPSIGSQPSTLLDDTLTSVDTQPSTGATSGKSSPTPEQKRLYKRRKIIQEIVDTEVIYNRDMTVVVDIYKATAMDSVGLSKEDERLIFSNSDEIVKFSSDFSRELKRAAKDVYEVPRRSKKGGDRASEITSSTIANDDSSSIQQDARSDEEKDSRTKIGEAFKKHLTRMEAVYSYYTKNHDTASRKVAAIVQVPEAAFWLKECANESSDLTHAWDLNSLLVKPVQRFLKYPLLLQELMTVTDESHPDYATLKEALSGVRDMAIRINEKKRHAEIVNNVVAPRKRKESNVASALSKAFGRQTEKVKQKVGLAEYVEDRAFTVVSTAHFENRNKIEVVRRDIERYLNHVRSYQAVFDDFLSGIESWGALDEEFGRRGSQEYKNKWLAIRRTVDEVRSHGLSAYTEDITDRVLEPLNITFESLAAFETGLMAKRDERVYYYSKYRSLEQRGAKMDKRTRELGEEYIALNKEAKHRMSRLLSLSQDLSRAILRRLIQYEKHWWNVWATKFVFMANQEELPRIVSEWKAEFSYFEPRVLSLGICNGSLLADAVNFMNFDASGDVGSGEYSPRQLSLSEKQLSDGRSASFAGSQGSPSLNFNAFASPAMAEATNMQNSPFLSGRARASSTTSGNSRTATAISHSSMAANKRPPSVDTNGSGRRPNTSAEPSPRLPHLSIQTPSPSLGPFPADFTLGPRPTNDQTHRYSSVFTSAMPMDDSPRDFEPNVVLDEPAVQFVAASVYEFNIDRSRREAGRPYLTYTNGEVFDVIGERGELWLARNQDDPSGLVGWIWNKHFVKIGKE